MTNKVEQLPNGIIYVQKIGDQTEQSLLDLVEKINIIAKSLRSQGKRVLILSNAQHEGKMDTRARQAAAAIGQQLDYDKSATYGSSTYLETVRKLMINGAQLDQKVANFETKQQALDWLLK